jgi:hypothetical protein
LLGGPLRARRSSILGALHEDDFDDLVPRDIVLDCESLRFVPDSVLACFPDEEKVVIGHVEREPALILANLLPTREEEERYASTARAASSDRHTNDALL